MKNLVIILLLIFSSFVFAQEGARISFSTGDKEMDMHLNDVNVYAKSDITVFRKDLTVKFKASEGDMDTYLIKEKINPADVYYGYVVSSTTGKSIHSVMKMHKEKKGWGSIAKELGIKPGSDRFHQLKDNTLRSIDREKVKSKKGKSVQADMNEKDKKQINKSVTKSIEKDKKSKDKPVTKTIEKEKKSDTKSAEKKTKENKK